MKNLYIDVGSTTIKYMYGNGMRAQRGSVPFPRPNRESGGFFEVSAGEILDKIIRIIDAFPEAENVLFSVQMHGYILSCQQDIYISWRDRRSLIGNAFEGYEERYGNLIGPYSGTSSKPNLAVYSLLYNSEHGLTINGELFSLGSYIMYVLTGCNRSHATDLCALGFYLFDGTPNKKLLQKLPFFIKLPKCGADGEICGTYRAKRIWLPVGDQQCSVLAVEDDHYTVLNIGTAAQVCRTAIGFISGRFESRPYFGGNTLCTKSGLIGGAQICSNIQYKEFEASVIKQYGLALADIHAEKQILCMGGAFRYYGKFLKNMIQKLGYEIKICNKDTLDGLQIYERRYGKRTC